MSKHVQHPDDRPAPQQRVEPLRRCAWANSDALMQAYHDEEWGRPERRSLSLFEKLLLDGLQAGLSWRTILHRREGMRAALDGFDPKAMALYNEERLGQLMADPRLIRNRAKMTALVANARSYLVLQARGENFSELLWQCVEGVPVQHNRSLQTPAPTQTAASVAMSKLLKLRGFSFCGPTICYAFMQAVGMVNDHDIACPQHQALAGTQPKDPS